MVGYLFLLFPLLLVIETISVFFKIINLNLSKSEPTPIFTKIKPIPQKQSPENNQAKKRVETAKILNELAQSFDLTREGDYQAYYGELTINEENFQFNGQEYPHYQDYNFLFNILTIQKEYFEKIQKNQKRIEKLQAKIEKYKIKEQQIKEKIKNLNKSNL